MDNEYDCKANMLDWSSGTPQFTSPLCAAAPAKLRPSSSVWQAPRNMAAASADNSANSLSLVPEDLTLGCFGTNLTQRAKRQGYRFFVQGYLHKINITDHHGEASVSAKCFRSMRKSERPHSLRVCFDPAMKLINISKCSCKAGLSGRCSHLVGLVQALMHYQQWGMKEIPTEMSCTELQQRVVPSTTEAIEQLRGLTGTPLAYLLNSSLPTEETVLGPVQLQVGSPLPFHVSMKTKSNGT
ncbi:hypothetical protein BaRGS_00024152 [Batillaria attramentaria]|uniref:SWIM-type domain-containing protein n=1 Tax=Batillaria attramentaria TaxID=370345 RepID=A0ABD0KCD1_9CAEN